MPIRRDPDEIIQPFSRNNIRLPSVWWIVGIVLLVIAINISRGSFYTIEKDEVGVVTRFGKYSRATSPGLHFKIPLGVENVYPVKVDYVYKEEFGFRTKTPGIRSEYDTNTDYSDESLMLTGDLNVLDVEWIVRYKLRDPYAVLFHVRNYLKILRDVSESVVLKFIGDYTFNEVLTEKRTEINMLAKDEMQKILDSYGTGIQIVEVLLQDVNPPEPVKPAFNEVNAAKQEKEKMINEAWEVYNRQIPQAKGEALKVVSEAEGYAMERTNKAEGDAKRFLMLREEYDLAKDVTRKRLYLENLNVILEHAGKKYVVDSQEKGILPLLNLSNEK